MNLRPEEPRWPDRDRFILSKGHTCPIQYSALVLAGPYDKLLEINGITKEDIVKTAEELLK